MKKHFLIILSVFIVGCSVFDSGKMPITSSSEDAIKLYTKGCELIDNLRANDSKAYFQKAIEEDPEFAMAYLRLANAQFSPKEFFTNIEKAREFSDKASEGEQLWIKGTEAGANGLARDQRMYYSELENLYPSDVKVLALLGNYYYGLQMFDSALVRYNKIIDIDEKFAQVYNMLGYTYRSLLNFDEAENSFKKYIELIPNDPNPYDSYAELLLKMGRYDESIMNYKKSLKVNPYFQASHLGIATNLNFKGEHVKARNQLHEFFENAKNYGHKRAALYAMAVSHIDEGNHQLALKMMRKSMQISEKNNDPIAVAQDLIISGNILIEYDEYDRALDNYLKAKEIVDQSELNNLVKDGFNRAILFNMARVALEKHEFEKADNIAKEFFTEVSNFQNSNQIKRAHLLLGAIALKENNFAKALEELRQGNQKNPYNIYLIALAYEGLNDYQTALGFYQKVSIFNSVNDINLAFIKNDAIEKIDSLKKLNL